jgi:hypothetical protein
MYQSTPFNLRLPHISDEEMQQGILSTRDYTIAILKRGAAYDPPRSDSVIWEHGRRNFALRAAGVLSIVCPIRDGTTVAGIDIFDTDPATVEQIMLGDPAIQAGVLTYELHPARSFPGDSLRNEDASGALQT